MIVLKKRETLVNDGENTLKFAVDGRFSYLFRQAKRIEIFFRNLYTSVDT